LHNNRSKSLDILNQFKEVKQEFLDDINFVFNETIILSKVDVGDNVFYDQLLLYMLTIPSYSNEFYYLIAERQNIIPKLRKKLVRTSSIQIGTSKSLSLIDEYYSEYKKSEKLFDEEKRKVNSDKEITIE